MPISSTAKYKSGVTGWNWKTTQISTDFIEYPIKKANQHARRAKENISNRSNNLIPRIGEKNELRHTTSNTYHKHNTAKKTWPQQIDQIAMKKKRQRSSHLSNFCSESASADDWTPSLTNLTMTYEMKITSCRPFEAYWKIVPLRQKSAQNDDDKYTSLVELRTSRDCLLSNQMSDKTNLVPKILRINQ